jgi:hypothetical protein
MTGIMGELEPPLPPWPCEAYGPGGLELGYVCFVGGSKRRCGSRPECYQVMAADRERIWSLMTKVGADQVFAALAAELGAPDAILGADSPIGLWCPECGEPTAMIVAPGSPAFCGNESCRIIMWDPTETHSQMLEHGVMEIRVEFSSPPIDCGCPQVHGLVRHDRETCTDPVVIKLDWFPD